MAGFSGFERVLHRYGGIASRRELLAAGWTETEFWFALWYGNLDRIRQGWYAASDLPDDARAAWRAGGRLACVSALTHYGLLEAEPSAEGGQRAHDDALHICLPRGGRVGRDAPPGLIVHWSTADWRSGSRQAVSPEVAVRQARACARRNT